MDSLSTRTADRQCRSPHIGFHARGSRKPVHTGRADTRSGPASGVGGSPSPLLGSPPEGTATFTHGARENRGEQAATCERSADGARGPGVPAVTVIRPRPCASGSRRTPLRIRIVSRPVGGKPGGRKTRLRDDRKGAPAAYTRAHRTPVSDAPTHVFRASYGHA